jgi:hypothetical protein
LNLKSTCSIPPENLSQNSLAYAKICLSMSNIKQKEFIQYG